MPLNTFNTQDTFELGNGSRAKFYSLPKLEKAGIGFAEQIIHDLAELYKSSEPELAGFGKPRELTLVFGVAQGNPFTGRGLDRVADPGLIRRVIGGHCRCESEDEGADLRL